MLKHLSVLFYGMIFGAGLAVSGMTDTHKVQGFLDVFNNWDYALVLVMASAVSVTLLGYRLVFKRQSPSFDDRFHLPELRGVDRRLLIGAVLFGIGWGLYGYCPGPAFGALVYGQLSTIVFVLSMFVGMHGFKH